MTSANLHHSTCPLYSQWGKLIPADRMRQANIYHLYSWPLDTHSQLGLSCSLGELALAHKISLYNTIQQSNSRLVRQYHQLQYAHINSTLYTFILLLYTSKLICTHSVRVLRLSVWLRVQAMVIRANTKIQKHINTLVTSAKHVQT